MADRQPPASVDAAIKDADKRLKLPVGSLAQLTRPAEAFTTGNFAIDHIIGCGGFPRGRSVELYGPPASGKSTSALQAAAILQRTLIAEWATRKRYILYADFEYALDLAYCSALGLDVNHPSFLLTQPDTFEQGAEAIQSFIMTGEVPMCIVDSVAAMTPADQWGLDKSARIGLHASLVAGMMKPLNSILADHEACGIFLNHLTEPPDMSGRGIRRESSTGGRALKFFASVRIAFKQVKNHKAPVFDALTGGTSDFPIATDVQARVVKNRVGPPFREALVRVRYGKGFDEFWSALQVLTGHKRVIYSSGYFYFERSPDLVHEDMARQSTGNKRPYIQSETNVLLFADNHPAWRDAMIQAARGLVADTTVSLMPEPGLVTPETVSLVGADRMADLVPSQ